MVRQHALMECVSVNLHDFLDQINGDLSRTDKEFPRDGIVGLLRAGRPIVCWMARQLPNKRPKHLTGVKRLDEHLVATSDYDARIKAGDDLSRLDC